MEVTLIGEATGHRNLDGCQDSQEGFGANDPLLQLVRVRRHSEFCPELPKEMELTQARNRGKPVQRYVCEEVILQIVTRPLNGKRCLNIRNRVLPGSGTVQYLRRRTKKPVFAFECRTPFVEYGMEFRKSRTQAVI